MLRKPITILAAGCLMMFSAVSFADSSWLKGTPEEQIKTLADLQPGLGTVMIEYSRRFATMYYSAKGGNWAMADYQQKEMREAQEVGENTRPAKAPMLKAFESSSLDKLAGTIKAKDWKAFTVAFHEAAEGCNGCHAANGYPFIRFQLPTSNPSPTSVKP